jgi:hypothetical protein
MSGTLIGLFPVLNLSVRFRIQAVEGRFKDRQGAAGVGFFSRTNPLQIKLIVVTGCCKQNRLESYNTATLYRSQGKKK